jgi:hypothetical protein
MSSKAVFDSALPFQPSNLFPAFNGEVGTKRQTKHRRRIEKSISQLGAYNALFNA